MINTSTQKKTCNVQARLAAFILALVTTVSPYCASARSIQDMFDQLGGYTNAGAPATINGQVNNYYFGGSLSARLPTRGVNVLDIRGPSVKHGCGSIDLYAGSFSFISSDQIIAVLRNIGAGVVTEAFFLALDTFVPVVSAVIKKVQAMAQWANNLTKNTCSASQSILKASGYTQQLSDAKSTVSTWWNTNTGVATDSHEAYVQSANDANVAASTTAQMADPIAKQSVPVGNIVWRAIYNADFGDVVNANQYKELLMSMVGTIVYDKDTSNQKVRPPIEIDLSTLLGNTSTNNVSVKLYECESYEEFGCINPGGPVDKILGSSFRTLARDKMLTMVNNMRTGTALTFADQDYIATTPIPLYKLMALASADSTLAGPLIDYAADIVAVDMTYYYLREALKNIGDAIATRRQTASSVDAVHLKEIDDNRARLIHALELQRTNAYARVSQIANVTDSMIKFDQVMARKARESLRGTIGFNR